MSDHAGMPAVLPQPGGKTQSKLALYIMCDIILDGTSLQDVGFQTIYLKPAVPPKPRGEMRTSEMCAVVALNV